MPVGKTRKIVQLLPNTMKRLLLTNSWWLHFLIFVTMGFTLQAAEPVRILESILLKDGRLQLRVASSPDRYYVLHRKQELAGAIERAVALRLGEAGSTTMTEPLGASGSRAFYRVAEVLRSAPLDTDGDGLDDVTELLAPIRLSPLNPAKEIS